MTRLLEYEGGMLLRIAVYSLMAALMVLLWVLLPNIYEGAATAPDEATGHVATLNNHGTTVYVTALEKTVVSIVTPALFVATLALGAIYIAGRRVRGGKDHH